VQNEGDNNYVLVEKDGLAVKKHVTVGQRNGINTEILSGLTPGEKVITEGLLMISDNTKIKNVN
jgi:membrane fusion protein (multidrug efflux system)